MDVHKKLRDPMLAQDIDEVSKILSSNDEIDINHLDQEGFSFLHKAVSTDLDDYLAEISDI